MVQDTTLPTHERWFARHGARLVCALRGGPDARFAEQAVQDTCLHAAQHPPPDDIASDDERLFAWLLVVARRRAADIRRRERRRAHALLTPDCATAPVNDAERAERAALVRRVLDHMAVTGDSDAARLLELRFLEEHSVSEISELLNVPPKAVSARLQRAKHKFRAAWGVAGGG